MDKCCQQSLTRVKAQNSCLQQKKSWMKGDSPGLSCRIFLISLTLCQSFFPSLSHHLFICFLISRSNLLYCSLKNLVSKNTLVRNYDCLGQTEQEPRRSYFIFGGFSSHVFRTRSENMSSFTFTRPHVNFYIIPSCLVRLF